MAVESEDFDPFARLKALRLRPLETPRQPGAPRVVHISLYCYKSFPIRIFHALGLKDGVDSHAVFFKNNFTNNHLPVTPTEIGLLKELIASLDPEMITMSIMAPYVVAARQAVAAIREISAAPIVLGGKFPTISPTEALEFADFACKGEGEFAMLTAFERLRQGGDIKNIRGLWYTDDDGRIVDMGQERLYQEMDDIPYPAIGEPQMHFIELDRLSERDPELDEDEMLMMAGRGCVYLCSFCVNSVLIPMNRGNGRFVRIRSPENVIEEVNYRRAKNPRAQMISFNDEVFGVFDDWVEDFSAKYKDQVGLPFECELVPKLIKERNVELLADAGMLSLHFGIQSGHDEVRKEIMHRPGTNDEFLEKAKILQRHGVTAQYDMILSNPFDTSDGLAEALTLLLNLGTPIRLNTYEMQYFPHYPFTNMALEAGFITEADVTYERLAEAVYSQIAFRPRLSMFDRRSCLENGIYIIPWTAPWMRRALRRLAGGNTPITGLLVSAIAKIRYWQDFEGVMFFIWLRRIYLGAKLFFRGDFGKLGSGISKVLASHRRHQFSTGRLSKR